MTNTNNTWQVDPQGRFRRVFDEAVVIHQEKAEALVLNEVGASFLELCDGQRTVQQIIELMLGEYDVGVDELISDVQDFIAELSETGVKSIV